MIWMFCILILFFCSCGQKPQERHYTEIIVEAPHAKTSTIPTMFSWKTPQGWEEVAGGEMRLAAFHPIADPKAIDCYITSLPGVAGGLEANLERWLGQLGLNASDHDLKMLTASAQILTTKDGQEIKVFDFTVLQPKNIFSDKSMIAAVISLDQTTVFVKMTGSIKSVEDNKDHFLKLIGSFRRA